MTKKTTKKSISKIRRTASKDPGLKHGWRSGLEERVAADLKALGIPFEFEIAKLEYIKPQKTARYTPDFFIGKQGFDPTKAQTIDELFAHCIIVETKGRFLTADRQKHLLIKDQFPNVDIRFVFSNSKQRISKTSTTTYGMWCVKHGFKFSDHSIPDEWFEE